MKYKRVVISFIFLFGLATPAFAQGADELSNQVNNLMDGNSRADYAGNYVQDNQYLLTIKGLHVLTKGKNENTGETFTMEWYINYPNQYRITYTPEGQDSIYYGNNGREPWMYQDGMKKSMPEEQKKYFSLLSLSLTLPTLARYVEDRSTSKRKIADKYECNTRHEGLEYEHPVFGKFIWWYGNTVITSLPYEMIYSFDSGQQMVIRYVSLDKYNIWAYPKEFTVSGPDTGALISLETVTIKPTLYYANSTFDDITFKKDISAIALANNAVASMGIHKIEKFILKYNYKYSENNPYNYLSSSDKNEPDLTGYLWYNKTLLSAKHVRQVHASTEFTREGIYERPSSLTMELQFGDKYHIYRDEKEEEPEDNMFRNFVIDLNNFLSNGLWIINLQEDIKYSYEMTEYNDTLEFMDCISFTPAGAEGSSQTNEFRYYFRRGSQFLMKWETPDLVRQYDKYKNINGIWFPTEVRLRIPGKPGNGIYTYEELKINEDFSPEVFIIKK